MSMRLTIILLGAAACGCTGGPGFFKQSGQDAAPLKAAVAPATTLPAPLVVVTQEINGAVKALVEPSAALTQVMNASEKGAIAGMSVAFPPGSLAVSTEVTLSEGENLASEAVLKPLALGTEVQSSGPAMEVASSIEMDAQQPFVLALSLPTGAGLNLADDPLANLIVIYKVRIAESSSKVTGIIPRGEIEIKNGLAYVATRFFGSFQTVLTKTLVSEAKQVPTPVAAPVEVARTYFTRGAVATSFGDNAQKADGFQAWVLPVSPAKVGDAATLSAGFVTHTRTSE